MIIIYSTFSNLKQAQRISELLIKNKLAGCINIFSIDSIYSWKGKVVKDKEYAAFIKTKKQNFKKVEQFILKHHSYTTPCIIEIPVKRITKKYLNWLNSYCWLIQLTVALYPSLVLYLDIVALAQWDKNLTGYPVRFLSHWDILEYSIELSVMINHIFLDIYISDDRHKCQHY